MRLGFRGIVIASVLLSSCGLSEKLVLSIPEEPAYDQLQYWAAHPELQDASDSSYSGQPTNQFDIPTFFVCPTVYFPKKGGTWNADPLDPHFREKFETPIAFQSSAFNVAGPVFAPYYRQAAYQVYTTVPSSASATAYEVAYRDVQHAFDQFLQEIPLHSPFILASHSQGTHHLTKLISEHLDKSHLNRLVAAYLIGAEVNACEFPIPLGERPDQTGCVLSWRTHKEGSEVQSKNLVECVAVVNPLNWTTTTDKIYPTENGGQGGLTKLDKGLIDGIATAQIHNGVLWTELPNIPGAWLLRTTNYHRGDINLYYGSIQQNVLLRSLSYLKELRD